MYLDSRLGFLPRTVAAIVARPVPAPVGVTRTFSPFVARMFQFPVTGSGFRMPPARLGPALPRYGGTISLQPANTPIVSQAPAVELAPVPQGMDVPAAATQSLGPDSPGAAEPADSSSAAPAPAAAGAAKLNPLVLVAGGLVLLWAVKGGKGGPTGKRGW